MNGTPEDPATPPSSDEPTRVLNEEEAAQTFAPFFEVFQNGVERQATTADLLELFESGGPRYVIKDKHDRYISKDGRTWTFQQREALVIPDGAAARRTAKQGRAHGVPARAVRIRRAGTCGIKGYRLKPGTDVSMSEKGLDFRTSDEHAFDIHALLAGAKRFDRPQ